MGPETLAGQYLRRFWRPVYVSTELPGRRAVPIRAMSEDLSRYRGRSGDAYIVARGCPHRGTQLSTGVANRSAERLGSGDAAVILLRSMWKRELRQFSESEPPTPVILTNNGFKRAVLL